MGSLAVLHEDEVPIELGAPGQLPDLVQLVLRVRPALHGLRQSIRQALQQIADGVGATLHGRLDGPDLRLQVGVAGGAGTVDQLLALQGGHPLVADIGLPSLVGQLRHVAVGAGEVVFMLAALAHEGLKFRMLDLELADAGAGIRVVREGLAVHNGPVIEIQNGVRIHCGQVGIGQGGGLLRPGEVVLHVALGAGEGLRRDVVQVLAHGVGQIEVGDHELAGGVGVKAVTGDGFRDLGLSLLEGDGVGRAVGLVHHGAVLGRFAAEAVGQSVGPPGGGHVLHRVEVASCAGIVFVEGHTLVDFGQHGVILHIVVDAFVFRVGHIGGVDIRVLALPLAGSHDGDGGAPLRHRNHLGRFLLRGSILRRGGVPAAGSQQAAEQQARYKHHPNSFHMRKPPNSMAFSQCSRAIARLK